MPLDGAGPRVAVSVRPGRDFQIGWPPQRVSRASERPTFSTVRKVHIELMRDEQGDFPAVDHPDAVRSARVWHCKYRSLQPLASLTNLEGLDVATFPDETLEPISSLRKLRYLSILHFPKVQQLEPLGSLSNLEVLRLATLPSWDASGKRSIVSSLAPLARVQKLRHLELLGVVPADDSLDALSGLSGLRTIRLHGYPAESADRLRAATSSRDEHAPEPWF